MHYRVTPGGSAYSQGRLLSWICLGQSTPTPFNLLFRQQAALSLLLLHIAHQASDGILTVSSIGLAIRLSLRSRLTLNRLALFRKPWSFGGGASHPPYRYLFLHLLFQFLQSSSRCAFSGTGMLPYQSIRIPRLRQMAYTRLLSMHSPSTSELLRTL